MKYDYSDELIKVLRKLKKKDPESHKALKGKIWEVINSPDPDHYKPLKYDLKNLKRVHVKKSFVLIFRYKKEKENIKFLDYDHHDKIYEKTYK